MAVVLVRSSGACSQIFARANYKRSKRSKSELLKHRIFRLRQVCSTHGSRVSAVRCDNSSEVGFSTSSSELERRTGTRLMFQFGGQCEPSSESVRTLLVASLPRGGNVGQQSRLSTFDNHNQTE